jgi:tRNA wybutosine-synthesizing protein 4
MDSAFSDVILSWTSQVVNAAMTAVAVYEQTCPDDAFGRVMVKALAERGCPLLGIHGYATLQSQTDRFKKAGYTEIKVKTMNEVFEGCVGKEEIKRLRGIEMFDEFEEWRLMQGHYFIATAAVRGTGDVWAKEKLGW